MAHVLMVSKPVEAPWNDSSKNLVRDLAAGLVARRAHVPIVLTRRKSGRGARRGLHPRVRRAPVYPAAAGASGLLRDQARLSLYLGVGHSPVWERGDNLRLGRRAEIWHLFFAPNPKSSLVMRGLAELRGRRSVQTVASAPHRDLERWLPHLLFSDRVVALSEHTAQRLESAGVRGVRVIPPSVPDLAPLSAGEKAQTRRMLGLDADARVILYPGDLEFSGGARLTLEAFHAVSAELGRGAAQLHLVMACRAKTARARAVERELRARAFELAPGRVHWVGETGAILPLLGSADIVALPADDLYAKMDYPLAVLEAMMMGRPAVVGADTPAAELAARGEGAAAVATRVEPLAELLSRWVRDDAERERRGVAARAQARRDHLPSQLAAAYESVYDELC